MFCIHCGNTLLDNASFCTQCGKQQIANAGAPTVVVKPAMSRSAVIAIVLAVLLIPGVAILGILAAIAIPAYQDYTQRVQVTQGLMAASPLKLAYAEYVATTGELPSDIGQLDTVPQIQPPLQHIALTDGLLILTFDATLDGGTLSLEPWIDSGGSIHWLCGNHQPNDSETAEAQWLTEASARDHTSIKPRLLPAVCR